MSLYIQWVQYLPQSSRTILSFIIPAAHWALSLAMFASILLSLSYAARKRIFAPLSMFCIILLSLIFNTGLSFVLSQLRYVPSEPVASNLMGERGLILSNSQTPNETVIILLNGMEDPLGPRVTAAPESPLFFQASTTAAGMPLPPVPFAQTSPPFLNNVFSDININSVYLQRRFSDDHLSYLIYAGALIFMLSSLGFIMKISAWPLAGFFLGVLAFRGILSLETFLNSQEMQEFFAAFFQDMIPLVMVVPFIFLGFSLLLNIYSFLVFASKRYDIND